MKKILLIGLVIILSSLNSDKTHATPQSEKLYCVMHGQVVGRAYFSCDSIFDPYVIPQPTASPSEHITFPVSSLLYRHDPDCFETVSAGSL